MRMGMGNGKLKMGISFKFHVYHANKNSIFPIPYSPLLIFYSPFLIPHCSFPIPHYPLLIPQCSFPIAHSPFLILHSPFSIPHSPFLILHSPSSIPHSPFHILHSPFREPVLAYNFKTGSYCEKFSHSNNAIPCFNVAFYSVYLGWLC